MTSKYLLVAFDKSTAGRLERILSTQGIDVDRSPYFVRAKSVLEQDPKAYDSIILNGSNGTSSACKILIRSLREAHCQAVMSVAVQDHSWIDAVGLLDAGADDCIDLKENASVLLAKFKAHQRRGSLQTQETHLYEYGDIQVDTRRKSVSVSGERIELTRNEYLLLEALAKCEGAVLTRPQIAEYIYYDPQGPQGNNIEVFMSRLRKKLGGDGALIKTVFGQGYKLAPPEVSDPSPEM